MSQPYLLLVNPLNRLSDSVGTRGTLHAALPYGGRAPNALQLIDNASHVNPGAQGNRGQPGSSLRLGRTAPRLAGVGENFTNTLVVIVHRNIEVSASNLHPFGDAGSPIRAGTGLDDRLTAFSRGFLLAILFHLADVQHLLAAAAVPVDRNALAAKAESQLINLRDLFPCGAVAEIQDVYKRQGPLLDEMLLTLPRKKPLYVP